MAVAVFIHRLVELDEAVAILEDFTHDAGGVANGNAVADAEFFAWLDHATPAGRGQGFHPQDLARAIGGKETGGDDAGIVQHQQIATAQIGGQIAELAMLDLAIGAMHDHHA